MAARIFQQFRYSLEKKVVELHAEVAVGGAGAVTLTAARSKGIKSVTKETTAGQWTVVFSDAYQRLMSVEHAFLKASGVASAPHMFIISRSSTGCVLQFCNASGSSGALAAGNPASGETALLKFTLSDSTAI